MRTKNIRAEFPVAPKKVQAGSKAFRSYEKRDAMYKVATFLVDHYWAALSERLVMSSGQRDEVLGQTEDFRRERPVCADRR